MGNVLALMGSVLMPMGSVLAVMGSVLIPMGSVLALMGNVWPPREVRRLLKGEVLAPAALLCEIRREQICLAKQVMLEWAGRLGLFCTRSVLHCAVLYAEPPRGYQRMTCQPELQAGRSSFIVLPFLTMPGGDCPAFVSG